MPDAGSASSEDGNALPAAAGSGLRLCLITDRLSAGGWPAVRQAVQRWAPQVSMVQLREKDLSARDLLTSAQQLIREVPAIAAGQVRLVVNGRLDVALAAGAGGVHFGAQAPPPKAFRRLLPDHFVVGVSCHSLADLQRAEAEGADYAFYSPIYLTASKPGYGPALGLAALREAVSLVRLPLYALGGITPARLSEVASTGVTGVAAIGMFQSK